MLHGMSIMLSFSSLYGCYLLCTPASAVKVFKTQIPEARQGSNLFPPPVYLILLKTILKITKNTTALVGKNSHPDQRGTASNMLRKLCRDGKSRTKVQEMDRTVIF